MSVLVSVQRRFMEGVLVFRAAVYVRTLTLDTFHGRLKVRTSLMGGRLQCTPLHAMYGGNIAMGSLLHVWHFLGTASARQMSVLSLPPAPMSDVSDPDINACSLLTISTGQ